MKTRVIQTDPDGGGLTAARPARPGGSRAGGRIAAGAVTAALGVGALALGGVLIGVNASQRDADGFYDAEGGALTTPTRALVSHDLDVHDGPGWLLSRLGDVRVTTTGARDGPVFVGVGRRRDVDAYLAGVAHEVTDFDGRTDHAPAITPGTAVPAPPASQTFWARSSSGTGTRTVVWPVEEGDWAAVVMNTDGSASVRTDTRVAISTDVALWAGSGLLLIGAGLAGAGTVLIASGRSRARRGSSPDVVAG